MYEVKISQNEFKVLKKGNEIGEEEFKSDLRNWGKSISLNLSLISLFFTLWAGLVDFAVITNFDRMNWWRGILVVVLNLVALGTIFKRKPLRVKFTGSKDVLKNLKQSYKEINKSSKAFQVETTKIHNKGLEKKNNAGCSHSIVFKKLGLKKNKVFKSNLPISSVHNGDKIISFLPGFAMMIDGDNVNFIDYNRLSSPATSTVTTDEIPSDGVSISETWLKLNKNGTKDKRYKENKKLFRVPYFKFLGGEFCFFNKQVLSSFNYFSNFSCISITEAQSTNNINEAYSKKHQVSEASTEASERKVLFNLCLFSGIFVALADGDFDDAERNCILSKLEQDFTDLYPKDTRNLINMAVTFQLIKLANLSGNSSDILNFVSSFKNLSTNDISYAFDLAREVSKADGEVSKQEEDIISLLENMFDQIIDNNQKAS